MAVRPSGDRSVMAARHEAIDSLDLFPTPPWATRALVEDVLAGRLRGKVIWEPAAGLGHMSGVLSEYSEFVIASDVHNYGAGHRIGSFVGRGPDVIDVRQNTDFVPVQWIITNPPFNLALEFAQRAITEATEGVALLVRSVWAEGSQRYHQLFSRRPPSIIAQFCERVPMVAGRWDPAATTATSYAWFIWERDLLLPTQFAWIPPGARARHSRATDVAEYARKGCGA